jgi:altronate dehydratase small subunit
MTSDPHIFRVDPDDNVAVAAGAVRAGQTVAFEGRELRASDDIPTGHKVAVARIAAGAKVIKYGSPIGSATRDILAGEHVHTHNLKSDYLPTRNGSDFCG